MVHFPSWTGYPFLANPALLFRQFREGNLEILKMLFYHFYPALCLIAKRLTGNDEAAKQIAGDCLENLWTERSGIENLEAIKLRLYIDTYQCCSQFMKTAEKNREAGLPPSRGVSLKEEEAMAVIVYAEILSSIEETPGAPEWLSSRLLRQPAGRIFSSDRKPGTISENK